MKELVDKLYNNNNLNKDELLLLIENYKEISNYVFEKANDTRNKIYQKDIYIRGLIEVSNYCKNDCLYCGIRKSNKNASRYRLSESEIYECCDIGYNLGFRTFVLQSGEDPYFTDEILVKIIKNIHNKYPDCAITLSFGERSKESYQKLYDAKANRYLLRHESINDKHYSKLHPKELTIENRKQCLYDLKEIGFQTGAGFMVGSPFQTIENIVEDLLFLKELNPEMVGIGPFIPHLDTPFKDSKAGDIELTLFLLAIVRLLLPRVLLPATTALSTLDVNAKDKGILIGCNVIMPNLSPSSVRDKYMLYNNKLSCELEAAENLKQLVNQMESIGYKVVVDRGDYKEEDNVSI
ncbi:MAG: [FeFe] hydrogenase H-cluster radical SAM maturase HydE [Erysipelotrichaceae bacterium]|nr:[FeFe] hydrogenase H-cluster radical SAM maturase HydE [Erysipelotrichaceae bacterium]